MRRMRSSTVRTFALVWFTFVTVAAMAPWRLTAAHGWTDLTASASCIQLAAMDHTATNSSEWGRTLLSGHGARGGWFGVDVCGNGVNTIAPGGANLSCDRAPTSFATTGCAPGRATYDGFGLSFQCVELAVRFAAWAFGDSPSSWLGDADALWLSGHHPRDFTAMPNGSSQAPVPGDMLVWGTVDSAGRPWPGGPAGGHIAVVAAVSPGALVFVEQNALSGTTNVPRETTSLMRTGNRWIVGGSLATRAGARALYGWLHSSKNSGKFDGTGATHGIPPTPTPAPKPTPKPAPTATATATAVPVNTPQVPSGADPTVDLPTLAQGVAVTAAGGLADLVWGDSASPPPADAAGLATHSGPHAVARDLGAPSGVLLAPDQTPAVTLEQDSARDVYVRGRDGALYLARTMPSLVGVTWQSLGTPDGVTLVGSVIATTLPDGIAVAALGADGNLYWRAGPSGSLGGWQSIGHPSNVPLQRSVVLAGAPGSGVPLAVALGRDGLLYQASWADTISEAATTPSGWTSWSPLSLPSGSIAPFGSLVAMSEPPAPYSQIGQWSDVPLDIAASDARGVLWLFRLDQQGVWRVYTIPTSHPVSAVVGGLAVPSGADQTPGAITFHVYVTGESGLALGAITLRPDTQALTAQWEDHLVALDPSAALPQVGAALPLGPNLSALVTADAERVLLVGTPSALPVLASGAPSLSFSRAVISAGAVPPPAMVSARDFGATALDPRWLAVRASAYPTVTDGSVSLAPSSSDIGSLLLQSAPAGDFSATTSLTLPVAAPASLQAGMIVYLDDGDWLTLGIDRTGTMTFCPVVWGHAYDCQSATLGVGDVAGRTLRLQLTRAGDTFQGALSLDGVTWVSAGHITIAPDMRSDGAPVPSPSPTSTPIATATPQPAVPSLPATAPLAFTNIGLFSRSASTDSAAPALDARAWPSFDTFMVTSSLAAIQPAHA